MANERLRGAIVAKQLTVAQVAARLSVDPKTAERWITRERVPHRGHREAAAKLLGVDEVYLWPSTARDPRTVSAGQAELVTFYPSRSTVPADLWRSLVLNARESIDILVYAGLFFPEMTDVGLLANQAQAGCRVRLLFGDPAGRAVALRGEEEGFGTGIAHRVTLSLRYFEPILAEPGVELRLHDTTLYASLYRGDETLLVNVHMYGAPAAQSPVLHLQRVPGGRVVDQYLTSFDRVWAGARRVTEVADVMASVDGR
jgi:transcriptional regulator with XRE-family HTH domain